MSLATAREAVVVDLNLRLVSYLVTVLDEGHFGRAAQRLYISTPALSQQIRKLEQKLGVELIDRSAHPLQPTPAGRRFLPEARAALAAAQRAVAAVRAEGETLRIGFMTAALATRTRPLLDLVRRESGVATIELVELGWAEQASAVRDGKVDASLMRPPVADAGGLRLDVLCKEPRVVALPVAHRLANRDSISVDELDGEPHLTDHEADREWVRWWACDPRPSGRPVVYGPSVRTIDELLEVVATGVAISITSKFVQDTHRHPDVVFVPVRDVEPASLCLCTRAEDSSPLIEALRDAARRIAEFDLDTAASTGTQR